MDTMKFFRTQSPRHFEGGDWNLDGSCRRTQPLLPHEVSVLTHNSLIEERHKTILQFLLWHPLLEYVMTCAGGRAVFNKECNKCRGSSDKQAPLRGPPWNKLPHIGHYSHERAQSRRSSFDYGREKARRLYALVLARFNRHLE